MNKEETKILGKRFKEIRKNNLNLSREKLAEKLDVSPQFIQQIESGAKSIPKQRAIRLCELANCRLEYLLNPSDNYATSFDAIKDFIESTEPIVIKTPYSNSYWHNSDTVEITYIDGYKKEVSVNEFQTLEKEIHEFIEFKFSKLRKD